MSKREVDHGFGEYQGHYFTEEEARWFHLMEWHVDHTSEHQCLTLTRDFTVRSGTGCAEERAVWRAMRPGLYPTRYPPSKASA